MSDQRNGYHVHMSIREGLEVWDVIHWVCGVPITREATYMNEQYAQRWIALKQATATRGQA